MSVFVTLTVIFTVGVLVVTAQESACPSFLADFNAYCSDRCVRMETDPLIGPHGPIGKPGPRGLRGDPGPRGAQGVPGIRGIKGYIGEKGSRGMKGEEGLRGPQGVVGEAGPKGEIGEKGSKGAQGISGPQGFKGAKGLKGSRGPIGPRGPPGISVVLDPAAVNGIIRSDDVGRIVKKIAHETVTTSCRHVSLEDAKVRTGNGGVFDIYSRSYTEPIEVFCDLETDGGGWTVFQKRQDGSQSFYKNWSSYVSGFGRKSGEFWLGLETIYQMTKNGNYELRIDLEDFNGNTAYAKYGSFSIDSSYSNYRIDVSSYSGTAGNSLYYHTEPFSAWNNDNDASRTSNCASMRGGGWWFKDCSHYSNLNGLYRSRAGTGENGVVWWKWKGYDYLKRTEMKFRKI